jgi:hypothetical protein
METWKHILMSFILAALFYPFYKLNVLWIMAGGVLIDIDHYLWYGFKFKRYGLKECYHYCAVTTINDNWKQVTGSFFIFHNMEFLILASVLSFYSASALMFTVGLLPHYALDFIWHARRIKRPTHAISFFAWLLKRRIQKV